MVCLWRILTVAGLIGLVVNAGCSSNATPASTTSSPASATKLVTTEDEHGHKPSAHGGTLVSIGTDNYHAEVVFEQAGKIRLFMLGKDESRVVEIESQTVSAFIKAGGIKESIPFELKPKPQPGDQSGMTSQFVGEIPQAAAGKPLLITIPNLRINGERFRVAFNSSETHEEAAMPAKLGMDEESKLFLTAGGIYTYADIKTNGNAIPTVKYKGIRAEHDDNPKVGQKICPISKTKANPKFTWVIGGKSYEFCCVPCIEEFVVLAKQNPGEIKDPTEYVKK